MLSLCSGCLPCCEQAGFTAILGGGGGGGRDVSSWIVTVGIAFSRPAPKGSKGTEHCSSSCEFMWPHLAASPCRADPKADTSQLVLCAHLLQRQLAETSPQRHQRLEEECSEAGPCLWLPWVGSRCGKPKDFLWKTYCFLKSLGRWPTKVCTTPNPGLCWVRRTQIRSRRWPQWQWTAREWGNSGPGHACRSRSLFSTGNESINLHMSKEGENWKGQWWLNIHIYVKILN